MWHVSVAQKTNYPLVRRDTIAREILEGLGDADLGEWVEEGSLALHVRRRLSEDEARGIGPALDIRGTPDARERVRRLVGQIPVAIERWAASEARV